MNRRAGNLADQIGATVEYRGINAQGKHMAANGGPMVTDIFDTLESMLTRFGRRIKIDERNIKHSAAFKQGQVDEMYTPREGADRQELFEYGSGRLKKLLAAMPERHPLWPNSPAMRG